MATLCSLSACVTEQSASEKKGTPGRGPLKDYTETAFCNINPLPWSTRWPREVTEKTTPNSWCNLQSLLPSTQIWSLFILSWNFLTALGLSLAPGPQEKLVVLTHCWNQPSWNQMSGPEILGMAEIQYCSFTGKMAICLFFGCFPIFYVA